MSSPAGRAQSLYLPAAAAHADHVFGAPRVGVFTTIGINTASHAGGFCRNSMGKRQRGFTLVELLVAIAIIAVLVGILLPVLSKARDAAQKAKCMANGRSIAQAIFAYMAEYHDTYPPSYYYAGMTIQNGVETPGDPSYGYIHWSALLFNNASKLIGGAERPNGALGIPDFQTQNASSWNFLQCPAVDNGGLPPTDTYSDNLQPGQITQSAAIDYQAPRCAYTLNEALCPRNKFVLNFQGATRTYNFVRGAQVRDAANTVLVTEWNTDWHVVQGAASGMDQDEQNLGYCKSHRPIHGFNDFQGTLDMDLLQPPIPNQNQFKRVEPSDLVADPETIANGGYSMTRLDWVGRNHGRFKKQVWNVVGGTQLYDMRLSMFTYADGHGEMKFVGDTIQPFQWGDKFYSLNPNYDCDITQ